MESSLVLVCSIDSHFYYAWIDLYNLKGKILSRCCGGRLASVKINSGVAQYMTRPLDARSKDHMLKSSHSEHSL